MSKIIVIDPGHGGRDPGAVGNNLQEKDLTLDISLHIAQQLQSYDVEVHLTRSDDIYLSLSDRVVFANNLKADLFYSVHINAGGGTGFESYVHTTQRPVTVEYQRVIHHKIMDYLIKKGIRDRGTKSANFQVLRQTAMPAVLAEYLFIDTLSDVAFLRDRNFRFEVAAATAQGIAKALELKEKSQSQTPSTSWNPTQEIADLKASGLINTIRQPSDMVTWGEFATVMNRLLARINNN